MKDAETKKCPQCRVERKEVDLLTQNLRRAIGQLKMANRRNPGSKENPIDLRSVVLT
jgi:hypothetical protein